MPSSNNDPLKTLGDDPIVEFAALAKRKMGPVAWASFEEEWELICQLKKWEWPMSVIEDGTSSP